MLYGLEAVKANIRNREGKRVFYLGKGDQINSEGRDWLGKERIPILPAEQAKPDKMTLLTGGYVEEKPEHMTHLNAEVLVCKTHPRIAFRGAMDLLEAELILTQILLGKPWDVQVGEILDLARRIIRCDVLEEPLEVLRLCGLSEDQLRQHSHNPQAFYGQPHFMPTATDGMAMAQLNRVRCVAREAERRAVDAFADREGNPTRSDILRAMNRMSSMLYILMIQMKAGM